MSALALSEASPHSAQDLRKARLVAKPDKFQDFKWTICAFTRWDLRPCGGQLQTLKTLPLPGPRLPSKACRVYACYISRAIQPFSARFCCFLLPRSGVEVPAGVGATVMMLSFILNRWQNSEMP